VLRPEPTMLLWLAAVDFFSWTVLRDTPDSPAIHNRLSRGEARALQRVESSRREGRGRYLPVPVAVMV
jgi:hypothetical protein